MVSVRFGAENDATKCLAALLSVKVSHDLRSAFEEKAKVPFEGALEKARGFFGVVEDAQAASFTAIALRALLFGDPLLEKKEVEGKVYLGSEVLVSDVGTILFETLSLSALPQEGLSFLLEEATSELAKTAKTFALGVYALLYGEELVVDGPKLVREAIGSEYQPLLSVKDHEELAFEAAKALAAEEVVARIAIEAAAERLWEIVSGKSNFVAARAKKALALTDGKKLYFPKDFAPIDHEHPEYLKEGEAAANALYLEEDGKRFTIADFALEDHEHPEFVKISEITNANFLVTSDGRLLSASDLALANHVHPEYLALGETAYAAKAFTDGKKLYFPEDFAPIDHAEDREYVKKNPKHDYLKKTDVAENTRTLQGFPLSYFALANHTHPEFLSYQEADKLFRLSSEPLDVVEEVRGFVVRWF